MNIQAGNPGPAETAAAIIADFNRRTTESKRLSSDIRAALSDKSSIGVGFSKIAKEALYPIVATRAEGANLWDVDGNRYVDILMGMGINLFGHNPDFVREAIEEQIAKGFPIGPQSDLTLETADLFRRLTGKDRVTFSNTGTEAVATALRVARAETGREKTACFIGSYHGHFDQVLNRVSGRELRRREIVAGKKPSWLSVFRPFLKNRIVTRAEPAHPGITAASARDVILLEYGDPRSLEILRKEAGRLAAVLVEPVQSRCLELQPRDFLHELRAITERSGTALIFDEMISGFRVAPGGAQEHFGVEADLATYGKIAGGGLPLSVIAGSNRFMDHIDGGVWQYGDDSAPRVQPTFFAGTYCRHPLALAAARATARRLVDGGPAIQKDLNTRTEALVQRLNDALGAARLPVTFTRFGSFFSVAATRSAVPPMALNLVSILLLNSGIHLRGGDRGGFLSTAHTQDDIDTIHDAFLKGFQSLADFGLLNRISGHTTT